MGNFHSLGTGFTNQSVQPRDMHVKACPYSQSPITNYQLPITNYQLSTLPNGSFYPIEFQL
ncbi:MAG TPA: hypothetical protein DD990_23530 [Cyanobacteria bacterium UBA11368]|nr:hypothetical protein [Cyanobacteria bacterium UBA11368]